MTPIDKFNAAVTKSMMAERSVIATRLAEKAIADVVKAVVPAADKEPK